MDIALRFKNFLVSILTYISQLLSKPSNSPPAQSQPSQTMDLESAPVTPVPAITRQNLERRNLINMDICHIALRFKNFLVSILTYISQLLPKSSNSPPTQSQDSQPSQTMDLEAPPATPVPVVTRQNLERRNLQWQDIIMGFCFTSALEIALQSTQTSSQLSPSFHWLSLAVVLTFSTLFVAKFMSSKYPVHAQAAEKVAVFFVTTAFFLAIAISLPPSFHIFIWAIYAVLLLCGFIYSFF